ncbi:MAG: HDOD domain-containing protein, partial [Defluviitaleaceae bacterium]|nr:HDOD domain-containing protein [Defluviitaleaceae bacterium]
DNSPTRLFDSVINLPCLSLLEKVGLDGFTNGHVLFVPINQFTLLSDVSLQCSQPPDKIIFLLDEQTPPEDIFIEGIGKAKDKGFRFAIEGISNYEYMRPIIEQCDYVFISFRNNKDGLSEYKKVWPNFKKQVFVATDVDSISTFDRIRYSGFGCFEGKFYSLPVAKTHNNISPVKVNRIQLINVVRTEDFAIEEVVRIVSRDPSLTISLLKLINSPYLGLSQKVKSIQQAVALLGQKEVRRWVTAATAGLLAEDKPQEITRVSLLRARFCENLARHFEMGIHAPGLFLMGLFSILDVVLEMSMAEALKVVAVSEPIHDALVNRAGEYYKVIEIVLKYEAGDWTEVKRLMTIDKLNVEDVLKAYTDAVQWYDSIASAVVDDEA